jgi:hypothetical protein
VNVENVCENHHRHESLQNRVIDGSLIPQFAKSVSGEGARDCDRHVGSGRRDAHPLILEFLDDVIEKGVSGLGIWNLQTDDDRREFPGVVLKPL